MHVLIKTFKIHINYRLFFKRNAFTLFINIIKFLFKPPGDIVKIHTPQYKPNSL